MSNFKLERSEPWFPHPAAAPLTEVGEGAWQIGANGTGTCAGGWQLRFCPKRAEGTYGVEVEVRHEGLAQPRDALRCIALWGEVPVDTAVLREGWDYLVPEVVGPGHLVFRGRVSVPRGAAALTLRYLIHWARAGRTRWSAPRFFAVAAESRPSLKIAAITGHTHARRGKIAAIADNVVFYRDLCERACNETADLDLLVLPEVALQWQLPGSALDTALSLDSPEVETFAAIARTNQVRILLGLFERDGDAVYNCAALLGPDGRLEGKYHKVHLAVGGESESGVRPGEDFVVLPTEIGRIGFNICMDSSAAESARMAGLNGADILLLPIMGDHRASRWNPGPPVFNESRWQAIMRTRAMDNQLCLVAVRNSVQGSCIIDRKGDILAWNEGDEDYIVGQVDLNDGYRTWNGGCFRAVNWVQRRPHLYGAYTDESNWGNL